MYANILRHTFDEYKEITKKFHGYGAPGVLIGGFMVDVAVKNLPDGILYDAICETRSCLPDAIQILTPCTVGNGWLKIIDLGLFALTFYDKNTCEGVRVFLDPKKVESWPEIKAWYLKLKPKNEQDEDEIIRQIGKAGTTIFGVQRVKVRSEAAQKKHKGKIAVCPKCNEAYPSNDGPMCQICQGNTPYLSRK